ncbi:putative non-ribosomal peptide synthetase [Actinacidiphila reveromycinica]|uniref:Putative non-ribosomal peptide synthetase n=1 Tax=Actinacidiphila reveromycinica TaxID=659352 RepID=A0A7U3VSX6_9ACTN|nr:putative non-ribosomal peptide synthetase [Streptomyces sp. SN-593]
MSPAPSQSAPPAAPAAPADPVPTAPLEFPASYDQERMWFFHRLDPGNPTYNVPLVLRLRGALDAARLDRALRRVVERHEILRTTYAAGTDGALRQFVHERADVRLEVRDLGGPAPAEPATDDPRVRASVRETVRAPFDLTGRPPLRARLVRLAADDHLLVFCVHHIATDGWSLGLLVTELDAFYRADAEGRPDGLPDLPIQYADYAEWQRDTLTPEALADRYDHWREVLAGLPPRIALPTDRPRPAEPTFRGARVDFDLPAGTARGIRALARRHGATLHMALLAGWNALLHRYGAGSRIVVGTLLANRDNEQLAPLMGLFVNTLPVRVDVDPDQPFTALLAAVRAASLDVQAHQDTPVDGLVHALGAGQDAGGGRSGASHDGAGGNPLFQVLFALQNFADQRLRLGGLDVERVDDEEESTRFDLELHVWEHPEHLHGSLVFDTDLFDLATAERIAAHYRRLLDSAVLDPDAPVGRLPLRPAPRERELAEAMARGGLLVRDAGGLVPPEGVPGEVWTADGAHTGLRGVLGPDGAVRVLDAVGFDGVVPGRVEIGGRSVQPAAVEEELLRAAPGLADVAVVPRAGADGGAELLAYVVPDGPADTADLAAHLPVPGSVVPVSRLPLTPDGAVDVPALLRLPVADAIEAGRLEKRLRADRPGARVAVLPAPAAPASLPRLPRPSAPAVRQPAGAPGPAAAPADGPPALVDGGPAVPPVDRTLVETLERVAGSAVGDLVLLREDGGSTRLAYGELRERALRALGGLRALGLGPGDRVLLQLEDHVAFLTVLWACVLGGQVAVPLAVPADYAAGDAACGRLRGAWDALERPLVVTADARLAELRAAAAGWPDLRAAGSDALCAAGPAAPRPADPDDPVLLMLTSGSTGRPKAVVLRHRNVLARSAGTAALNGLGPQDVSVNWLPLDHVGGVVMFHLRDTYLGCRQVHAPARWVLRDPLRWLDLAHRHRATMTWAPNFAFGLVGDRAAELPERGAGWDLSPLRFVMNAGEAIVPRVARRWLRLLAPFGLPGTAMRPAWGMSETSSAMVYSDRFTLGTTSDDDAFAEVGAPLPGCAVRIVDGPQEAPRVLAEGATGRLQVRGATVTTGYLAAPEQNAAAFTGDGWFDTGDLGTLTGGRLTLTGRAKDVVILNGVNHHSHEIESAVEELDCVEPSFTAAVAVRPPGAGGDELAVFFHPRGADGPEETARRVRHAVLDRIGVNPRFVLPVEQAEIPKTEIGKIQRAALRARFEAGAFTALDTATLPDHFHRPVWVPRALPPSPPEQAATPEPGAPPEQAPPGPVLLLPDGGGVAGRLAVLLRAAGREVVVADGPGAGPPEGCRPAAVVDLRCFGGRPAAGTRQDRREGYGLLELPRRCGRAGAVYVVTCDAVAALPHEVPDPERAALAGVLATLGHELPGARVLHLDLPDGDADEVAALLAAEVDRLPRERVVAHREGRRLARRLVPAREAGPDRPPFRPGGRYLVTGGAGGVGLLLARELTEVYGAGVLCLGRGPRPDALVPAAEYVRADVADAAAVGRAVREAEERWGARLDGVLHLAGAYREVPLDACAPADLDAALAAKADGARVLADLLGDREGLLFVAFSSVNGLFGGASVAGYSAASAYLDALAVGLRARGLDAYSLGWSMWDETGMSAGHPMKSLTRARGYRVLPPDEALASLAVALGRRAPHQLVGLDPGRPWIAAHLAGPAQPLTELAVHAEEETALGEAGPDRFGTLPAPRRVVVGPLPVDPVTGEVDRERLAKSGAREGAADGAPREGLESVIAAVWAEVLGAEGITRGASFFDLGGGSLQATRVHGLLQDRLGREVPMVELFRRPTLRALAEALEPAGAPAPAAGARGRGRAERRLRAAAARRDR